MTLMVIDVIGKINKLMKNILTLLVLSMLLSSCRPDFKVVEVQKAEVYTKIDTIYYYKVKDGTKVKIKSSRYKFAPGDIIDSWDF